MMLATDWIIWCGILANLNWVLMILMDKSAMNSTPLSMLNIMFDHNQYLLAAALASSCIGALIAIFTDQPHRMVDMRNIFLLMPQIFFIWLSTLGSIKAIMIEQYADGYHASRYFISTDQTWGIAATLLYTVAIINHFATSYIKRWKSTGSL